MHALNRTNLTIYLSEVIYNKHRNALIVKTKENVQSMYTQSVVKGKQ